MKQAIVTLTYVAEVDDKIKTDDIHYNLENCIDAVINVGIYGYNFKKTWNVPLKLQQTQTSIGSETLATVYEDIGRSLINKQI